MRNMGIFGKAYGSKGLFGLFDDEDSDTAGASGSRRRGRVVQGLFDDEDDNGSGASRTRMSRSSALSAIFKKNGWKLY